jgi:hypothetical protein
MFDHQEACRIEQEEAEQRMLRRQRLEEIEEEQAKEMAFLASKNSTLSEAERHARILAFMYVIVSPSAQLFGV